MLHFFKSAITYLFFAALLIVAKPFIGFSFFNRINVSLTENIIIKSFTKRKHEFVEGSSFDINAVQNKLSEPQIGFFYLFVGFLNLLFPTLLNQSDNIGSIALSNLQLRCFQSQKSFLLNGKLII